MNCIPDEPGKVCAPKNDEASETSVVLYELNRMITLSNVRCQLRYTMAKSDLGWYVIKLEILYNQETG